MFAKPKAKPVVLGVLNPLANGRLTIKQNKIKQDEAGFGWRIVKLSATSPGRPRWPS